LIAFVLFHAMFAMDLVSEIKLMAYGDWWW